MLLALALYASTAHAASPPDSVGRPASSTRTRRTTTSSCWGVKARLARGENLPSAPSDSAPPRGRGQGLGRGPCLTARTSLTSTISAKLSRGLRITSTAFRPRRTSCACTQAEPGLQPKSRRLGLEPLYFPEDPPTLEG